MAGWLDGGWLLAYEGFGAAVLGFMATGLTPFLTFMQCKACLHV
jgi:hypothetical protein